MTAFLAPSETNPIYTQDTDLPFQRHPTDSDSRKRCRSVDKSNFGPNTGECEADGPSLLTKRPSRNLNRHLMGTSQYPLQGLDRNISSEVSALRQAAATAVAEFNEPLGPGLEFTAPDKNQEHDSDSGLEEKGKTISSGSQAKGIKGMVDSGSSVSLRVFNGQEQPDGIDADLDDSEIFTQHGCPPHGAKAIMGRRPRMEDAFTAVPFLLEVPVPAAEVGGQPELFPPRIAPQKGTGDSESAATGSDHDASAHTNVSLGGLESSTEADGIQSQRSGSRATPAYLETLHFFGVFDGHGGAEAALHCAQHLHQRIAEALAEEMDSSTSLDGADGEGTMPQQRDGQHSSSLSQSISFDDTDMASEKSSIDGQNAPASPEPRAEAATCNSAIFESALQSAFNKTDAEFGLLDSAALVGTTAVVTLVGSRQLYIANCGDSRAVLCRAGVALPLTDDHKANREDESARVEALGGQILFWNGVRVMGVLAVSRSIGDHCMRPYVIPEPEVTILARRRDDELLLLASDGLWDVLSNQMACTLAKRCLRRARQRGASRQAAARIAATVLTRAAIDRGSRDNVTVLVIDLSTGSGSEAEEAPTRAASMLLADNPSDLGPDSEKRTAPGQSMQMDAPNARKVSADQ